MRELVYYVAASLDGFIAGPDGQFDAFLVEGDHMEVIISEFADAIPTEFADRLGIAQHGTRFGTVFMGWNTYVIGPENGMPSPYRHLEQVVFSRRHAAEAENLTVTDADPIRTVRDLKREPGADIWLCGGGSLAAHLIDEIDRLVIKRNPFLFGTGVPLFGPSAYAARRFDPLRSRTFDSGVVLEDYVRTGARDAA